MREVCEVCEGGNGREWAGVGGNGRGWAGMGGNGREWAGMGGDGREVWGRGRRERWNVAMLQDSIMGAGDGRMDAVAYHAVCALLNWLLLALGAGV